jgi:hypothetical protein
MASNMVPIYSKAINSTEKFLCSNAIESSDERRQSESWHQHLQPVSYHNFALGAKRVHPLFGTDFTPEFVLMALTRLQEEEGEARISPSHCRLGSFSHLECRYPSLLVIQAR